MKSSDKFLVGIVAGAVILVGVALAASFLKPKPTYRPEDDPEAVAYNYLLSLGMEDYDRAYRYLSSGLEGRPVSVEEFVEDVRDNSWQFRLNESPAAIELVSTRVTGDLATVTIRETRFRQGGLFDSGEYSDSFEIRLGLEAGAWKIIGADRYWVWCWDRMDRCQ